MCPNCGAGVRIDVASETHTYGCDLISTTVTNTLSCNRCGGIFQKSVEMAGILQKVVR